MSPTTDIGHHHSHGPANRRRRVLETAAPLFVVEPPGPIRGGVVVLHDVLGLTGYIEQYCRWLAEGGWLAVAPYHYYETGGTAYSSPGTALPALRSLTAQTLRTDVDGALDYLARQRRLVPGSLSAVGFSLGGYLAAWAARNHELAAAVSISPGPPDTAPVPRMPPLIDLVRDRRSPWLGIVAEADTGLSGDDVPRLRAAIADTRVPAAVETVPSAAHGFFRQHHGTAPDLGKQRIRRFLLESTG
ncbi:dienelactone hydrolase family protein [Prauserella alba]|uniref:Dienelactone hydrolase family protein n=1 Tax=Prauserella alba TaxID=176898 RepID=A0ABP4FXC8_9PSEU|nr:dienelactone hydrolase family protein [Prauserella alba]MCP2178917.1 carboxymethylenebutenolidase [Prauserella alba]